MNFLKANFKKLYKMLTTIILFSGERIDGFLGVV